MIKMCPDDSSNDIIIDITPKKAEKKLPSLKRSILYFVIIVVVTVVIFFISEIVELFYIAFNIDYGGDPGQIWTIDQLLRYATSVGASKFLKFFNIAPSFTEVINGEVQIYPNISPLQYPYSLTVIKFCTGIEAMALLIGIILATPTRWWKKVIGTVFIVSSIYFANVLRIVITVVLLLNGFSFYIAHEILAATMTIVFTIVFVLIIQFFIIRNFIDSMIDAVRGIYRGIVKPSKTKKVSDITT